MKKMTNNIFARALAVAIGIIVATSPSVPQFLVRVALVI